MLDLPWLDERIVQWVGLKYTVLLYKVASLIVAIIILLATRHLPPLKRQFFERDPSISYYNFDDKDVCDSACLIGCGLGISFTIIFVTSFIYNKLNLDSKGLYFGHKKWEVWVSHMIGLGYATLTTAIVTNILKATIARPRPAFLYLCNYKGYYDAVHSGNFTSYNANTSPNTIGDYNSCLNFSEDTISSFPSGHASFSFACMTYSVYVLQRTFKTDNGYSFWGMLTYSPLIVALWIAGNAQILTYCTLLAILFILCYKNNNLTLLFYQFSSHFFLNALSFLFESFACSRLQAP